MSAHGGVWQSTQAEPRSPQKATFTLALHLQWCRLMKSTLTTRRPKSHRALRIGARTVHLGAMAFVLVPMAMELPVSHAALVLLVASGMVMVLDDFNKNGFELFRYLQFWAVVAKACLLMAALALPAAAGPWAVTALVLGSVVSHAPGRVRQFALFGPPGPCAQDKGPGPIATDLQRRTP